MLERQSNTYEEAVTEYKRRYKREPPPGFHNWWERAVELNATIGDIFDTIMASLEPFWSISACEMRIRVLLAANTHNQISQVTVRNQSIQVPEGSDTPHTDPIVHWTQPILKHLPDLDVAMSDTDEPRVVLTHDELEHLRKGCSGTLSGGEQEN